MVHPNSYFDWTDYSVFGLLLTASVCIGIYFGFLSKRKQNTKHEYLFGSKEIGVVPLALSLLATQLSGVAMLGYPAEIYVYGSQMWVQVWTDFIIAPIEAYWFVPVIYNLNKTSMYEYLNVRFNPAVRTLGSTLFILKMMFLLPVIIYGPTLALSQVSGFSLTVIIPVTCIVCTFYTTLGGMKAVVWTDSLQYLTMVLCMLLVIGVGTYSVGGIGNVIRVSSAGNRLDFFNFSMDPTIRHTFWNFIIGNSFYRMTYHLVNQGSMQRCIASSTLRRAQISVLLQHVGLFFSLNAVIITGLIAYTWFADCDPVTTKLVQKPDQILPYFFVQITNHIPALPGIFLSAIFSASLSTMSTGLNSMSAVIFEDFIQPFYKRPISEARASRCMKITSIFLGLLVTIGTFLAQHLSGLVQGAASLAGGVIGALMGALCLGMFFPWSNSHGALAGTVSALSLVGWMAFGSQKAIYDKRIVNPVKPVSIAGCDNSTLEHYYNMTANLQTYSNASATERMDPPFYLYRISYNWYTPIGILTVLTVGMLVSWATGLKKPQDTDYQLFSPAIHRFLPRRGRRMGPDGSTAEKSEQSMTLMPASTQATILPKAQ